MKTIPIQIAALSVALVLFASACSQKATNTTKDSNPSQNTTKIAPHSDLPQFVLAAGDISAPAETYTDRFGTFHVQIKLTTAKADDLHAFMRQHINQTTELLAGTNVITNVHVPPDPAMVPTGRVVEIIGPSADDAHHAAVELDKLVR